MAWFGNKSEGGVLDVIRCDEPSYLVWKWRPAGAAGSTNKENAIRWGSSLRVKDGEVAVFVYKQEGGPMQDFIEGPFDDTIKTANLPVISSIIGMAYAGQSPFQAEVYFINLAGNLKIDFRVPYFDVFDPRAQDFSVRMAAGGSFRMNITDYRGFIRLHRLVHFELGNLADLVRDAVVRRVKQVVANAPTDHGIPVLQLERKLEEINGLLQPQLGKVFQDEFGINLQSFDLSSIEPNKDSEEYRQLRAITGDLEMEMRQKQNEINIRNLEQTQSINAENMSETLRIQREQAERLAALQTQQQYLGAHQINQQAEVLKAAANNLGAMGQMDMGGGSSGGDAGGGFNPAGVMAGMALGGAMGGQMAQMMGNMGQQMNPVQVPPPPPQSLYHVAVNGQNAGPFNLAQLQQLALAGQFNATMHVWKAGMTEWALAGTLQELQPLFQQAVPPVPPPPPIPPQAG